VALISARSIVCYSVIYAALNWTALIPDVISVRLLFCATNRSNQEKTYCKGANQAESVTNNHNCLVPVSVLIKLFTYDKYHFYH